MMSHPNLQGWLPFQIQWEPKCPMVDWCRLGSTRLLMPRYQDSVADVLRNPFNLLFRHKTPIETLAAWQQQSPGIPPTGFIFQVSGGGSALACQILASMEKTVVVSEAPPIDDILRIARLNGVSDEQRILWLRGLVSALGQPRAGGETQFFIKFDSWHALDLELVRKAYPEVPWIFIYSDPIDILVSQVARPAPHTFPGLMKFGVPELDQMQAGLVTQEEFCARVLATLFAAAIKSINASQGKGIALRCEELPEAMFGRIAHHFGLEFTVDEIAPMRSAVNEQAASPGQPSEKNAAASPAVQEAYAKWARAGYETLCEMG